ncbi:hypothetical protein AYO44_17085, partial [Planctomycetaceae bacterium SCGC AG-212-F19]
ATMLLALREPTARGQGAKKSDAVVKVTVAAEKPAADGTQVVNIMFAHDAGWHTYANPVGLDDLAAAQTMVTITGKNKLDDVKVDYPPGKLVKDKIVGDYKVWEDKVTIKATVRRAKGDAGPLEVAVKFQACTDKQCLLPATVKQTVP